MTINTKDTMTYTANVIGIRNSFVLSMSYAAVEACSKLKMASMETEIPLTRLIALQPRKFWQPGLDGHAKHPCDPASHWTLFESFHQAYLGTQEEAPRLEHYRDVGLH